VNRVGDDIFHYYLKVRKADVLSQNPCFAEKRLKELDEILKVYDQVKGKGQCTSLKCLAVNGHDLRSIGYRDGRQIGQVLEDLLNATIDDPEVNRKDILISMAQKYIKPEG
jgi:tRNA nucleotidyltransferase (CCA-adding enzyme)